MKRCTLVSALTAIVSATIWGYCPGEEIPGCQSAPGSLVTVIEARVLTANLASVNDLQVSNFELSQSGVRQKICGFVHVRQPSSIGILMDTSGSMYRGGCATGHQGYWSNSLVIAEAAIAEILNTSRPDDEYFLALASEQPAVSSAFTHDPDRIRAGLRVTFKGKTPLIDGMLLALGEMRKAKCPNRALLVISDGCDNKSSHSIRELSNALSALAMPVFIIAPGHPQDRLRNTAFPTSKSPEEAARDDLFLIAERTGGYVYQLPDKKQMMSVAKELSTAIRTPYQLYFNQPTSNGATRQGSIHLKLNGVRLHPTLLYGQTIFYLRDATSLR